MWTPPPQANPTILTTYDFFVIALIAKKRQFFSTSIYPKTKLHKLTFFCGPVLPTLYNLVFQVGTY